MKLYIHKRVVFIWTNERFVFISVPEAVDDGDLPDKTIKDDVHPELERTIVVRKRKRAPCVLDFIRYDRYDFTVKINLSCINDNNNIFQIA